MDFRELEHEENTRTSEIVRAHATEDLAPHHHGINDNC